MCKRIAEFPSLEFSPGNIAETPRVPDPGPQTEWQSAREAGRASQTLGTPGVRRAVGSETNTGTITGPERGRAVHGQDAWLPSPCAVPNHLTSPPAVHEAPFSPHPCQPLLRRAVLTGQSRAHRGADLHFPDDGGRAASFQRTHWPLVGLLGKNVYLGPLPSF